MRLRKRNASYALKILRPEYAANPRAVELMAREAEVGSQVAHPHLIPIFSASLIRPPYYVVMPWLEGATLEAAIGRRAGLSICRRSLWIVRQTAEALAALRSRRLDARRREARQPDDFARRARHASRFELRPAAARNRARRSIAAFWARFITSRPNC